MTAGVRSIYKFTRERFNYGHMQIPTGFGCPSKSVISQPMYLGRTRVRKHYVNSRPKLNRESDWPDKCCLLVSTVDGRKLPWLATSSYPFIGTTGGRQCRGIFNTNTRINKNRNDTINILRQIRISAHMQRSTINILIVLKACTMAKTIVVPSNLRILGPLKA